MKRRAGFVALGGLIIFLCGCATVAQRMDRLARSTGLEVETLAAGPFRLRAYARDVPRAGGGETLHVYLEGDGRPWVGGGTRVARNPHGERNLAFELMGLDPRPVIYLKRPCYQRLVNEGPCQPLLWTHERYSETVVATMEAALRSRLDRHPVGRIAWVGYSGGGVLAMLLAPRFEETTTLVTVGANLDVAAWAELHGYTSLAGSLDPARLPPLPGRIRQLHLAGETDANVPPSLVQGALASQPAAEIRVVAGADHTCCWADVWPEVLAEIP